MARARGAPPVGPGVWQVARHPAVVRRAARVALVVGVLLALLNHGDALLRGDLDPTRVLKILLTFCVPYSVSTWSSVLAVRDAAGAPRPPP